MNFNVSLTGRFQREAKRLYRKFASLKTDLSELIESLEENPVQGTSLGKNCYKIRLAIRSKGKGKSGGAQVVTHVHVAGETVYLLTIYDKSEKEDLADGEIEELLTGLQP